MKRRTKGKEAEINAKLQFVRDLVRSGQRAMKAGQSDLALACYSAAQEQLPLLFSIGYKAAQIARSKYRLELAQKLADKVSSESYLCDYWNQKAHKLSIECMIRRMTPWMDYGLAPKVICMIGGEGGYINLFELVKNPVLPPRKNISAKTQHVFDRLGNDTHLLFTLNTSTIFPEGELDFPVCWMSHYTRSMQEGLDMIRGYIVPQKKWPISRYMYINKPYKRTIAQYVAQQGAEFNEEWFLPVEYDPVWDWPTSYMKIWAENPEPWMEEHNAMLQEIKVTYPADLVAAKEKAHQEFIASMF